MKVVAIDQPRVPEDVPLITVHITQGLAGPEANTLLNAYVRARASGFNAEVVAKAFTDAGFPSTAMGERLELHVAPYRYEGTVFDLAALRVVNTGFLAKS